MSGLITDDGSFFFGKPAVDLCSSTSELSFVQIGLETYRRRRERHSLASREGSRAPGVEKNGARERERVSPFERERERERERWPSLSLSLSLKREGDRRNAVETFNREKVSEREREAFCQRDAFLSALRLPRLRCIVASATLHADRFSAYFEGCPVLRVPGRAFPVDVPPLSAHWNPSRVLLRFERRGSHVLPSFRTAAVTVAL